MEVAGKLLEDHKLTIIGKDKRHIQPAFTQLKRQEHTSMFAYQEQAIFVPYNPRKNKNMLVFEFTGKPEIIVDYNRTKNQRRGGYCG